MRLWPRSLGSQLLLLMAIALLVAQSINLALLLSEVRARSATFVAGGAVARAIDVIERVQLGMTVPRGIGGGPERLVVTVGALSASSGGVRDQILESRLSDALRQSNLRFEAVRVLRVSDSTKGNQLVVAVLLADGRWVNLKSSLPPGEGGLILRLILQTLVIFVALMVPIIIVGRHVTRPLRQLRQAAAAIGTNANRGPLPAAGPTDVRELITTFNLMTGRIRQMLEEKDRMLGAIGHDLRTPIASLRLRVEGVEDDVERRKMVDTIDEMGRTLEDLLSLARVGRTDEAPVRADFSAMVDALVQDFQDLGKSVTFDAPDRMLVLVRPTAIRRAIRNVIENAVVYGGEAEVALVAVGDTATLTVRDRGPGISDSDLERVFEGFVRLENSRSRETGGSGLGLTLARGIVREHGGSLTLENANPGLRAIMCLPLSR